MNDAATAFKLVVFPYPPEARELFRELDKLVLDDLSYSIGFSDGALKLYMSDIVCIGNLVQFNERELISVDGIGSVKLEKIKSYLAVRNLYLDMDVSNWNLYRKLRPVVPSTNCARELKREGNVISLKR